MTTPKVDVFFVGAGVASMATAIRLFQFSNKPLSIAIAEKEPELRYGGLAYAAVGNSWTHIFNIQVGRMSIFREDVEDFLHWINKEADRSHWPQNWKNMIFHISGPAPRRVYSDYIRNRFENALSQALSGSSATELTGEVVNIEKKEQHYEVTLSSSVNESGSHKVIAKHVVIGTGNLLSQFPFTKDIDGHPNFIRRQYMPEGLQALKKIPTTANVAIIGSSLSAYDTIITLKHDLKHTGSITLFSRTGLTPHTYPYDHQHQVIEVRKPPFIEAPYQGKEQLVKDILTEWHYVTAEIKKQIPDIHDSIIPERITKAWESYLSELIAKIPAQDSAYLLKNYNSVIATMRVAAMPFTSNFVKPLDKHNIKLIEADIKATKPASKDRIEITYIDKSNNTKVSENFDALVSNLNRETNYLHIDQPLWRELIDMKGYAVPQTPTQRGIQVSEFGELINQQGLVQEGLFAVGIPREGDEITRNGRQGAFAYNVATIKNHSISVALNILASFNQLDLSIDESLSKQETILLEQATSARINWLSSRTRDDKRVSLPIMLETTELLAESLTEKNLALNEARKLASSLIESLALKKMTDVSVTPKQLRENLGLNKQKPKKKVS